MSHQIEYKKKKVNEVTLGPEITQLAERPTKNEFKALEEAVEKLPYWSKAFRSGGTKDVVSAMVACFEHLAEELNKTELSATLSVLDIADNKDKAQKGRARIHECIGHPL